MPEPLLLQWGPRAAEFCPQWENRWVYRFADTYIQLDRDVERGSGAYAPGEWYASCSPDGGYGATDQAALDELRGKVTERRDELSNFLTGVDADHEIWEFDILSDQIPYLVGVASAGSFGEACSKYEQGHPEWRPSMQRPRLTKAQAADRAQGVPDA